jgi:hypothetical protein
MKAIAYPTPTVSAHTDLSAADLIVVSAVEMSLAEAQGALTSAMSLSVPVMVSSIRRPGRTSHTTVAGSIAT